MPTETTKLGGLLTALSNLCDAPPSPEKTYSDNVVQVVTTDAKAVANNHEPATLSAVGGATTPFAPPQPTTTALTEHESIAAHENQPQLCIPHR